MPSRCGDPFNNYTSEMVDCDQVSVTWELDGKLVGKTVVRGNRGAVHRRKSNAWKEEGEFAWDFIKN